MPSTKNRITEGSATGFSLHKTCKDIVKPVMDLDRKLKRESRKICEAFAR
ncbi:hypothetical protein [Paenibacillus wynnii]|nr:hypothetical protein [Paenibacillus wynnii]